jgi:WD40 repeat protein
MRRLDGGATRAHTSGGAPPPSRTTCSPSHELAPFFISSSCSGILRVLGNMMGHSSDITALHHHPIFPAVLYSGSLDGTLRVWDTTALECTATLHLHAPILSFMIRGRIAWVALAGLVSNKDRGGSSGRLVAVRLADGQIMRVHRLRSSRPGPLALTHDGRHVAVLDRHSVTLVPSDHQKGDRIKYSHTKRLSAVATLPSGAVVVGDYTGRVLVLQDVMTAGAADGNGDVDGFELKQKKQKSKKKKPATTVTTWHWHQSTVTCLAAARVGSQLLSGGYEGVLCVWDTNTGARRFIPRLGAALMSLTPVPGSGHEALFVATTALGAVVVLDTATMRATARLTGLMLPPGRESAGDSAFTVLPRRQLLVAGPQATLQEVDVASGVVSYAISVAATSAVTLMPEEEHGAAGLDRAKVRYLASSADGQRAMAVIVSMRGSIHRGRHVLVSLQRGREGGWKVVARVPDPHQAPISALAVRPDGKGLATGDVEGHVHVWRLTGEGHVLLDQATTVASELTPAVGGVHALAFCADSSLLAVADTQSVRLLDAHHVDQLVAVLDVPRAWSDLVPGRVRVEHVSFTGTGTGTGTGGRTNTQASTHVAASVREGINPGVRAAVVWDTLTGQVVSHVSGAIRAVGVGPQGDVTIALSKKSTVSNHKEGEGEPRGKEHHSLRSGITTVATLRLGLVEDDAYDVVGTVGTVAPYMEGGGCALVTTQGVMSCHPRGSKLGRKEGEEGEAKTSMGTMPTSSRTVPWAFGVSSSSSSREMATTEGVVGPEVVAATGGLTAVLDTPSHALIPPAQLAMQILSALESPA